MSWRLAACVSYESQHQNRTTTFQLFPKTGFIVHDHFFRVRHAKLQRFDTFHIKHQFFSSFFQSGFPQTLQTAYGERFLTAKWVHTAVNCNCVVEHAKFRRALSPSLLDHHHPFRSDWSGSGCRLPNDKTARHQHCGLFTKSGSWRRNFETTAPTMLAFKHSSKAGHAT